MRGKKGIGMNYYEKHISDYRRDATHLSPLEHGVYKPVPAEENRLKSNHHGA